jgi:hypothetical protein
VALPTLTTSVVGLLATSRCTPGLTTHWSGRATRQAFFPMRASVPCGPPLTGSVRAMAQMQN